ncbi:hypothetical protein CL6EHI_192560 [Entamoeba histolytica]|uniref:Uncharacterized protein n=1 Tax=Entamoeba histolytica TaxID=5759 RepID=A0A175JNM8_ENTHI|nr:hypothetical protein CL6EHI_192560 [Entamoeba histolytica]
MLWIFFIVLVQSVQTFYTPCMTTYRVGSIDNIGKKGVFGLNSKMNEECFSKIPNYKKIVSGHSIGAECYVHEDFMKNHFSDANISRCGQCFELFGPSLKPFTCMIAGSYWANLTVISKSSIARSIIVNSDAFNYLVTENQDTSKLASQISIRLVDCPFTVQPKIAVIDETFSEYIFQPFNSNLLTKYMQIGNSIFTFSNYDDYFHIPKTYFSINSSTEIRLISTGKYVLNIFIKNIEKGKIYPSSNTYPRKYSIEKCDYVPNQFVLTQDKYEDNYFTWSFYQINNSLNIPLTKTINNTIEVISSDESNELIIGIKYPTSFKITYHFRSFILNIKTKSNITLDSIKLLNMNVSNKVISFLDKYCQQTVFKKVENYTETILNKRCEQYSFISLKFNIKKGESLIIYDTYFIPRQEIVFKQCSVDSYDCDYAECDGSNSVIESNITHLWKEGCHPPCGKCKTGYICSKGSVCVIKPNLNKRTSSSKRIILILSIILFVFM